MELSVLIPTHNRADLLKRTLSSLLQQSLPKTAYEIVIVLDGCTDDTERMLSELHSSGCVRWFRQPHRGRIVARNLALRMAQGRTVLIFDDDLEADPKLLEMHVAFHAAFPGKVAFGTCPPLRRRSNAGFDLWAFEEFRSWSDRASNQVLAICASMDANFSASIELLHSAGGYDERFSVRELEFGLRLVDSGVEFHYLPNALAYHFWEKSDKEVTRDAEAHGADEVRLCRLRPSYRQSSAFASFESSSAHLRKIRETLARSGQFGRILLAVASRVKRFGGVRYEAKVWRLCQSVAVLRGAIREAGSWSTYKQEFGLRVPVLLYHNVGLGNANVHPGILLSESDFQAQVRGLLNLGFSTITVEQLLAWRSGTAQLPHRPILITFDDAYAELADSALPFLIANGCTATIFVPTAFVGSTNRWDEVQGHGTLRLMTADQIRNWSERGIGFGAHSKTHRSMPTLSDEDLDGEILQGQADLQAITGVRPVAFAYPFGDCDGRVRDAVSRWFKAAFTIEPGLVALGSDACLLPRIIVNSNDRWWGLKIRLFHPQLQQLRDQIALRTRLLSFVGVLKRLFDGH
jgi:glycosyltransferase involved in cell wall biosynthesis